MLANQALTLHVLRVFFFSVHKHMRVKRFLCIAPSRISQSCTGTIIAEANLIDRALALAFKIGTFVPNVSSAGRLNCMFRTKSFRRHSPQLSRGTHYESIRLHSLPRRQVTGTRCNHLKHRWTGRKGTVPTRRDKSWDRGPSPNQRELS